MQKQMGRWAIAIMRENGVEGLFTQDPFLGPPLGTNEAGMRVMLAGIIKAFPELDGKLRLVPVVVDIREMTAEEEARFREHR
jgi:hypothetical protein